MEGGAGAGDRLKEGLGRLNALVRELVAEPAPDRLLARVADAARDLTGADFSVLVPLGQGGAGGVGGLVRHAPRERFPDRIGARLAVPVVVEGRAVGELAVANEVGRPAFDEADETLLAELAAHAALALSVATARQAGRRADEERTARLDVALHDLRTPLTVAKGFLATIKAHGERLGPEDRALAFEAIERAHDRILELAEGALLAEPAVAEARPSSGTVDVAALLADLVRGAGGGAEGVSLDVVVEPGTPPSFPGDRHMARELLENLVGNAVRHSRRGQTVTVTVRREGASVRFDVTDEGPGIPPDEQARVFEQFYRTRQSVADGLPGSGLGLWTARRLAALQGGAVGLSSRAGRGTTTWATFPLDGGGDGGAGAPG